MRTSNDEYKTKDGDIISLSQNEMPPDGSKIWNGYDYERQIWVFEDKMNKIKQELLNKYTEKTDWAEIIGSALCVVGIFALGFLFFLFVI